MSVKGSLAPLGERVNVSNSLPWAMLEGRDTHHTTRYPMAAILPRVHSPVHLPGYTAVLPVSVARSRTVGLRRAYRGNP